jgi:two-component system, OmpR family, phosphate regulon sensor histidine kinase PhoR
VVDDDSVLAATLSALPDPVILIDGRGTVLLFNEVASRTWPSLAKGWPLSFTLRAPAIVAAVEQVLAGGQAIVAEYSERVPVERLYEFRVTPVSTVARTSALRSQPAALLSFRDLTEARRLDLMRVDFVANASHELRTPLASLLGFVETLQGPARNDEKARDRFLEIMRTQARRMARLVDDLLSLSRVEMSEHRRPRDEVDVRAIVRQMVDTLKPLALERGVEVMLEAGHAPALVAGDRDELARVAENLIENAIKYGQAGKRVDVSVAASSEGDIAQVLFAVRDHGPGIAPEHVPRLTERFYRVDTADSRDKGGTGLGLAIVKHIVNRHGGRLAIESRVGEGSSFRVSIPALPGAGPKATPSQRLGL